MKKLICTLTLTICLAFVVGCNAGGKESLASRDVGEGAPFTGTRADVTGTWWQMPSTDTPVTDDYVWSRVEQDMRRQYELNVDGTYDDTVYGFKGTWTYSDGKVTTDTGSVSDGVSNGVTIWHVSQDGQSMESLNPFGKVSTRIR